MKMSVWGWLLSLVLLPLLAHGAEPQPLPPQQAFKFSARAENADTIRARWTIADGYYLYHAKLHFSSDTPGVKLGQAQIPAGKMKHDPTFGEMEVHRHQVDITIPVERKAGGPDQVKLVARAQGCADMGLCYPPYQVVAEVKLPPAAPPSAATGQGKAAQSVTELGNNLGLQDAGDEFLDPDKAFALSTSVQPDGTVDAHWKIAEGYYLYKDKFHFKLKDAPAGVRLGNVTMPKGEVKDDPSFGRVIVYHHETGAKVPVLNAAGKSVKMQLTYQGCASAGLCYPPVVKTVDLKIPPGAAGAAHAAPPVKAAAQARPTPAAPQPPPASSNEDRFSRILQQGSLLSVVLATLGFGVLLAFTACMYPMIPILSSIIVGQGERVTPARGFGLSLIYVESLAVTFGVMGIIMAMVGGGVGIQAAFQTPWMLIPFALLFVVLSLSMFGFFNIQVPAAIQSRLNTISNQQKGGTLLGVAVMGVLSALIIGPCGGPILIASLAYAATSANPVHGFLALFALGNGMGLPLLLVGLTGGALLPRAGDWMNTVKAVAGVILLAVAIAILERMPSIFPPALTMVLWASLLIVSAIYMGALSHLDVDANGWRKLWKGVGLTALFYGFIVMVGGLTGATNVTDPLHGSKLLAGGAGYSMAVASAGNVPAQAPAGAPHELEFKRVKTVADLQRELNNARAAGKNVMLDFYADWCTYCKQFESYVFPTPGVQQALSNTVLLQADVTANDAADRALMKHVGVFLPPAILFFDKDGREMRNYRVIGYMKANQFQARVERAFGEVSGG